MFYSGALMFFSAPVASVLTLQFSQRVVIIVGGLLAASGMLLASLDLSLPWLYLTLGILQGSTLRTYSLLFSLTVFGRFYSEECQIQLIT